MRFDPFGASDEIHDTALFLRFNDEELREGLAVTPLCFRDREGDIGSGMMSSGTLSADLLIGDAEGEGLASFVAVFSSSKQSDAKEGQSQSLESSPSKMMMALRSGSKS